MIADGNPDEPPDLPLGCPTVRHTQTLRDAVPNAAQYCLPAWNASWTRWHTRRRSSRRVAAAEDRPAERSVIKDEWPLPLIGQMRGQSRASCAADVRAQA